MLPKTQSSVTPPNITRPALRLGQKVIYTTKSGARVKAIIEDINMVKGCKLKTIKTGKTVLVPFNRISVPQSAASSSRVAAPLLFKIGDEVEYMGRHFKVTAVNPEGPYPSYELDGIVWVTGNIKKVERTKDWHDGVPEILRDATWTPTQLQCTCGESFVSGEYDLSKHSKWCDLIPRKGPK